MEETLKKELIDLIRSKLSENKIDFKDVAEDDLASFINLAKSHDIKIDGVPILVSLAEIQIPLEEIPEDLHQEYSGILKLSEELFNKHARDASEFEDFSKKSHGVTSGLTGKRKFDGRTHILKHALKFPVSDIESRQRYMDRKDLMTEFTMSEYYNRILPKRSPKINLVTVKDDNSNIYLTSKFFENFQTIYELSNSAKAYRNFRNIKGFGKVMAASLAGGEIDHHGGNLGVIPAVDLDGNNITDEDGNPIFEAVKIDHGRSSFFIDDDISKMVRRTLKRIEQSYFQNIPFNITDFREGISSAISVSDQEIDRLIATSSKKLKDAGMNLGEIPPFGHEGRNFSSGERGYIEYENYYSSNLKSRNRHLQLLEKHLKIIEKFSPRNPSQEASLERWKNSSDWLKAYSREYSPVKLAINMDVNIDGKNPILYAHENNIKMDGKPALIYAINNGLQIDEKPAINYFIENNIDVNGKPALIWASENNIKIEGKDPIIYYLENDIKIDNKTPAEIIEEYEAKNPDSPSIFEKIVQKQITIAGKKPIQYLIDHKIKIAGKAPSTWAVESDIKIGDEPALEYFIKNDIRINKKSAINWASEKGLRIHGKDPLEWAIENNAEIHDIEKGKIPVIQWALKHDRKINNKPVLDWAVENDIEIDGEKAILWAVKKGRYIDEKPALIWAAENDIMLGDKTLARYMIDNNIKVGDILEGDKDPLLEYLKSGHPKLTKEFDNFLADIGMEPSERKNLYKKVGIEFDSSIIKRGKIENIKLKDGISAERAVLDIGQALFTAFEKKGTDKAKIQFREFEKQFQKMDIDVSYAFAALERMAQDPKIRAEMMRGGLSKSKTHSSARSTKKSKETTRSRT